MIAGGASLAAGIQPFPEPPKGSPGEIHAAASSLRTAASDIESGHGALGSASGMLGAWQGQAALAYHGCVQGLSRVLHAAVTTLHECAATVSAYAGALDRTQSGMRRLRPLYDDAVRRAQRESALAGQLAGSLPNANKSQAGRLRTMITGADTSATDAVNEANGYARAAQRLLDEFHREAGRYGTALSPPSAVPSLGPIGGGLGRPGPTFGTGSSASGYASALSALSGVIPLQLPSAGGESVFGTVLKVVALGASVVSTVGGACAAVMFWNPVGDGCGIASGAADGVGALDNAIAAATGHGSVQNAIVSAAGLIPAGAGYALGRSGERLISSGEDAANHVMINDGRTRQAIASGLDGTSATWSSREIPRGINELNGHTERLPRSVIDQSAGQGIEQELSQIDSELAGPPRLVAQR